MQSQDNGCSTAHHEEKNFFCTVYQHSLLTILNIYHLLTISLLTICLISMLLIIIFDAVSCLTHSIKLHIDKGCKGFKAVFLDLSNVFNTLPRQGLLDKVAAPNPPYWLVKWVHNYFTGRSQYIRVHNKFSSTSQITVVLFKAQFFPRSFSPLTLPIFSLNH